MSVSNASLQNRVRHIIKNHYFSITLLLWSSKKIVSSFVIYCRWSWIIPRTFLIYLTPTWKMIQHGR